MIGKVRRSNPKEVRESRKNTVQEEADAIQDVLWGCGETAASLVGSSRLPASRATPRTGRGENGGM
jgi:hypothetical protein